MRTIGSQIKDIEFVTSEKIMLHERFDFYRIGEIEIEHTRIQC